MQYHQKSQDDRIPVRFIYVGGIIYYMDIKVRTLTRKEIRDKFDMKEDEWFRIEG